MFSANRLFINNLSFHFIISVVRILRGLETFASIYLI